MPGTNVRLAVLAVVLLAALGGCIDTVSDDADPGQAGPDVDEEPAAEDEDEDCGCEDNESAADGNQSDEPTLEERVRERADADEDVIAATFDDPVNETVSLEIADNATEKTEGLMYRESLAEHHGMVFVYEDESNRSFWMRNTYIPLDIIFLDANRTVLNVEHADPEPDTAWQNLSRYRSVAPAQYVIELEQGFANETGLEPGVEVEFHEDLHADASD